MVSPPKLLVLLAFGTLLAPAALPRPAVTDDGAQGQELIEQFLAGVQTMSGRFQQSLVDADGRTAETSSGTFAVRRPGQLRWVYQEPYEQVLVADGRNVWSYDVDLAQVTVKPQAEVLSSTPALLLGGSRDVLDDFRYDGAFEDRGTEWVRLVPKDPDSTFERLELGFNDGRLTRMVFADNLDQITLVALLDVALNEPVDPALFSLSPPEGVDVVGRPAAPDAPANPS